MLAQHDHPLTVVSSLRSTDGGMVTSQSEILEMFNAFYEKLYTSTLPSDFQPESLQDLLDPLALGWLSDEERVTGPTVYGTGGFKCHPVLSHR